MFQWRDTANVNNQIYESNNISTVCMCASKKERKRENPRECIRSSLSHVQCLNISDYLDHSC